MNNVNEFPDKYELYIEPETAAKDWYLKELEQIFCERGRLYTLKTKPDQWNRGMYAEMVSFIAAIYGSYRSLFK